MSDSVAIGVLPKFRVSGDWNALFGSVSNFGFSFPIPAVGYTCDRPGIR